jgi:RNA polymerase sigma-70 factor (ECF subfamily)
MNNSDEFLTLITEFQGRLFGFVLSMLGDVDQANEILQETNLVLWRKSDEFRPGSDFKAWSFRVAHFQVMAFRQRQIRDRLVFSDDVIEQFCRDAAAQDEAYEQRIELLETCIASLSERNREVLCRFYDQGESLEAIATSLKRTANAVGQMLFRIRKSLIECVGENVPGVTDAI